MTAREELRQQVREAVDGRLNGHRWDGSDTKAVVLSLREDAAFVSLLVDAYLPRLVDEAAELALALHSPDPEMTTVPNVGPAVRTAGGALISRQFIDKAVAQLEGRWEGWLEDVGGRKKPFLDMNRADLMQASRQRKELGRQQYELSLLEVKLARTLRGLERVRDRYTPEDLDRLREEIAQKTLKAG